MGQGGDRFLIWVTERGWTVTEVGRRGVGLGEEDSVFEVLMGIQGKKSGRQESIWGAG